MCVFVVDAVRACACHTHTQRKKERERERETFASTGRLSGNEEVVHTDEPVRLLEDGSVGNFSAVILALITSQSEDRLAGGGVFVVLSGEIEGKHRGGDQMLGDHVIEDRSDRIHGNGGVTQTQNA